MAHQRDAFEAVDGLRLYENRWLPDGDPAAVLVVVHGFTEHSGRYAQAAERLNQHGYAVAAMDLRGHGRSEGLRAFIKTFDQYVDDLEVQLARTRQRWPGKPLFLFGHSMGATIVLRLVLTRQVIVQETPVQETPVRGIVLSAPALQVAAGLFPILRRLAGLIARIFPRLKVVRLGSNRISRDPAVVADFQNDPLVIHERFPVRTGAEILRVLGELPKNFAALKLPFLLLQGTDDKIVDPSACRRLISQAKSADKELRLYEGFYHDLLHEIDRETVLEDIVDWLDARR